MGMLGAEDSCVEGVEFGTVGVTLDDEATALPAQFVIYRET